MATLEQDAHDLAGLKDEVLKKATILASIDTPAEQRRKALQELGPLLKSAGERLRDVGPKAASAAKGTPDELAAMAALDSGRAALASADLTAQLYARACLDPIVEVACAIAADFNRRPQAFKNVDPNVQDLLVALRTKLGADPDFPDTHQRQDMYQPILGNLMQNDSSNFARHAMAVQQAAAAYAERVFDTGEPMLRQAFADRFSVFGAYLRTTQGAATEQAALRTAPIFNAAIAIFKSDGVAKAYGYPPATGPEWPIELAPDGDGAVLVEQITRLLQPERAGLMTVESFLRLELIAARGRQTISLALNFKGNDVSPDRAEITAAYSWATAMSMPSPVVPAPQMSAAKA